MEKFIPTRFCKVQDHITAASFGCEESYFDANIKDQPLKIINDAFGILEVESPDGEEWTIHSEDALVLPTENTAVA